MALEELCTAYWQPLYVYVRRRGHSAEDAEDLVQGFFCRLVEHGYFASARRERGRLRSFLLHQLNCYLADSARRRTAQKRGGGRILLSLDVEEAESSYIAEPATNVTPESLYLRQWALTLVSHALVALEAEYCQGGREGEFEHLSPALTEPTSSALDTSTVAAELGIPRNQVRVRVHRLRTKFRRVIEEQIGSTLCTSSKREIEEEMQALLSNLE